MQASRIFPTATRRSANQLFNKSRIRFFVSMVLYAAAGNNQIWSPSLASPAQEAANDRARAQKLCSQEHWSTARPLLLKLERSGYADKTVLVELAHSYQAEPDATPSDFKLAKGYATKALALDSEFGDAYLMLGIIEDNREHYSAAVEMDSKSISCKEPTPWGWYHRARAYVALHKYKEALADVDSWLKVIPAPDRLNQADKYALLLKGDILKKLGRTREALTAYRAALPTNRESTERLIIECFASQGKVAEAIVEATKLIAANPKDDMSYYIRAGLREKIHDLKGALTDLTKAIELAPTGRYYRARAKVYTQLGQQDLARQDLDLANKTF